MTDSVLRGVIDFFNNLGIYDVVLPFLLIWTVVFAILEKTKIFGTDKINGQEYSKKSLNAMIAFVLALIFVGSSQLVAIANQALAKIVLLILIIICFLILIGTFFGKEEVKLDKGPLRTSAIVFIGIGVLLIFAYQVGWLTPSWNYLVDNWNGTVVGAIGLILFIIIFMAFITSEPKKSESEPKREGG